MFKSVEEVNAADINDLVKLVATEGGSADYSAILDVDTYSKYLEAYNLVRKTELAAEKIAFAIRNRVELVEEFEELFDRYGNEVDPQENLTEFMNAIARESGELYSDYDYENRPESHFWTPSTC